VSICSILYTEKDQEEHKEERKDKEKTYGPFRKLGFQEAE
jgi:hypothetical protein